MEDYFRLVGMDCTPALRSKLDRALHMVERPMPEKYAEFSRTYTGDCPIRREDGLCALQLEKGEPSLPRTYRTRIRSDSNENEA